MVLLKIREDEEDGKALMRMIDLGDVRAVVTPFSICSLEVVWKKQETPRGSECNIA